MQKKILAPISLSDSILPKFNSSLHESDEALHKRVVAASKNEKSATLILLESLVDAESRRLYAVMGYPNLWRYVHVELGYSESQTSERVNAARLIKKTPSVKTELERGNLSLTSVCQLATHVKREQCNQVQTLELLENIKNKRTREVERILANDSTEAPKPDKIKVITKKTTRITIEVEHEFLELMNKVKELGGYDGMQAQEIFKTSMREFVKRREVKSPSKKTSPTRAPKVAAEEKAVTPKTEILNTPDIQLTENSPEKYLHEYTNTLTEALKNEAEKTSHTQSRHLSTSIKTKIRLRSKNQCEFISPITKTRCKSRTKLQFDHIKPHAAHGTNTEENIRHYCATHNRLAAIQFFGEEKMQNFLKK